ncbi:MAG: hypothetical protein U1A24_10680 [Cypionkella sp.]|uniref:hypothetical protein n=1 Tax=Cypionkella sp. TaxID=2811411 RepID=UPI002ABB305A|nr:hypothetical protein [Cypionkella sp.]MDZ4311004.1 hypothetical protein [Cypionkella sp.]
MNKQTRTVIERALMARPDASIQDLRNLVPALRPLDDQDIEKIVTPLRDARAKSQTMRVRRQA